VLCGNEHHAGANCSAENPSAQRNPGLRHTQTGAILKLFNRKAKFKLKINVMQKYFGLLSNETI
jgi:hypothetical protein